MHPSTTPLLGMSVLVLTLVLAVSAMRTMFSVLVTVAPPLLEMCMASGTKLTK